MQKKNHITSLILAVAFLVATVFVSAGNVVQAQPRLWYDTSNPVTIASGTHMNIEALGVGGTASNQRITLNIANNATRTIDNLYYAAARQVHTSDNIGNKLDVKTFWATTATFGQGVFNQLSDTAPGATVGTLGLQIGQKNVGDFLTNGGGNPVARNFGVANDKVASVVMNANGIALNGGIAVSSVWGKNAQEFRVDVAGNGTVGSFTLDGGALTNGGTINNLIFGSGTYTYEGEGTVGTVSFNSANAFTAGSIDFNAGIYDLSNANLLWNTTIADLTSSMTWAWTDIFEVANTAAEFKGLEEIASFTVNGTSLAWGERTWVSGANYYLLFNESGLTAATPEPATLAMLGLGLAGLGVARRRMKK